MSDEQQEQGVVEEVEGQQADDVGAEQAAAVIELEEISFGDAESPTAAAEQESPVIRKVREAQREADRKRREAEAELKALKAEREKSTADTAPELGPMPGIEEFDYDTEAHKEAVTAWVAKKQARDAVEQRKANEQKERERADQEIVERYKAEANALPVDRTRYAAAEAEIDATFSPVQRAVLLKSTMPAKLVYALGNNPDRLEKLSKITDPFAFAMEIGRAETAITSTKPVRKAPPPDTPLSVAATGANAGLERLYAEAQKSGNYTAYYNAKRAAKPKPD